MDNQSLAHSRYNCTYHIVFIPKYRRKAMFGVLRKEVGEILGKVHLWYLTDPQSIGRDITVTFGQEDIIAKQSVM